MLQSLKFEDVGRLIKQRRKIKKISQEQLASVSGCGLRFIRELENGKATCQAGKVFHVLHQLGVELFYDDGASE